MDISDKIFLETSNAIGAKLCRDALWHSERCNWIGDSMEYVGNSWTVAHRAFGPDLYSGTSGIALFLAYLFNITGEKVYRLTAEGGIKQSLSRLEEIQAYSKIAFYSGLTGIAYATIIIGKLFTNEQYIEKGFEILEKFLNDDSNKHGLDIVSGNAGAILALLQLYQNYQKDFLLDLAKKYGEELLNSARRTDIGYSWNTINAANKGDGYDLTGYSHGTAGIATALLELYKLIGEKEFLFASQQAFKYERHWFSPEHENWPDLRNFDQQSPRGDEGHIYNLAWCHGAPGIGLSRVRAYEILDEKVYRDEAEAAIRTTIKSLNHPHYASQENYSLCHGKAGNTELLIYSNQVFENTEYLSIARQVGNQGIEKYEKNMIPWPCGVQGGGETPNLMLGLAGIGYFYLRLFDPQKIPSILVIFTEAN